MDNLISQKAAIDAVMDEFRRLPTSAIRAKTRIEALPSAQPEIIHCRDCKHWREGGVYSYCQKLFNCGVMDVYDYMRAEDDFCSLAERGTNDGD